MAFDSTKSTNHEIHHDHAEEVPLQSPAQESPNQEDRPEKPVNTDAGKTKPEEPSVTILSTAKCQSVSGKSTLIYHVGVAETGMTNIRVFGNTGGGFFSKEWGSLDHITFVLDEVPDSRSVTSLDLFPLFKGKSVNTPVYLLAVLLNEELLAPL